MIQNKAYIDFCKTNADVPIFFQDWWLDTVCPNKWEGLVVSSGDFVRAILPLVFYDYSFGRRYFSTPPLTPYLGVYINYPNAQKLTSRLAYEKDVLNVVIKNLPAFDHFGQSFLPGFNNWLPFFWAGFNQTTYYTYRLNNLESLDLVYDNFRENIRREIRKAEKEGIVIEENNDSELLFTLFQDTLNRQGLQEKIQKELVIRLFANCKIRECGKIFLAKDGYGNCHSALFLAWDNNTAYYLLGGSNKSFRNSGAMSLLMWHAIKFTSRHVKVFDFEGSMLEPVERYFRAFGAEQTPYFNIWKTSKKEQFLRKAIFFKNQFLFWKNK